MSISTTSARAAGQVHRWPAVGGLADHLEVVGSVDQDAEPRADQRLVVGQQGGHLFHIAHTLPA
jgi:hypothetical protein